LTSASSRGRLPSCSVLRPIPYATGRGARLPLRAGSGRRLSGSWEPRCLDNPASAWRLVGKITQATARGRDVDRSGKQEIVFPSTWGEADNARGGETTMQRRISASLAIFLSLLLVSAEVWAGGKRSSGGPVRVRGYYRKDGTYVQPHYRSAPDGSPYNNWSTKGNVNPYTGEEGRKDPVPSSSSASTVPPDLDISRVPTTESPQFHDPVSTGSGTGPKGEPVGDCVVSRSIQKVPPGGSILNLDDGSWWHVPRRERAKTAGWRVADEIVACRGMLVNVSRRQLALAERTE